MALTICKKCGLEWQAEPGEECPRCERDRSLSALNAERTMREAAQLALTEWNGGIQQGRRIIDAEAYKRRWKESQADNARLREALEFYARDGWTGPCAYPFIPWIMEDKGAKARAALHPGEGETADPCDGCAYNNGDAALLANCVGCLEFDDRPHRVEAGPNAPVHWWEAKTTDKKE